MNTRNFALYDAATKADNLFSQELIRAYGLKKACEKRYQTAPHFDRAIETACAAKLMADSLWLLEMKKEL